MAQKNERMNEQTKAYLFEPIFISESFFLIFSFLTSSLARRAGGYIGWEQRGYFNAFKCISFHDPGQNGKTRHFVKSVEKAFPNRASQHGQKCLMSLFLCECVCVGFSIEECVCKLKPAKITQNAVELKGLKDGEANVRALQRRGG